MKSRRIAKNTFVLLLRMVVLMLVNLYCVRVLLARLGVVDYGVFNAVAGAVTMLSFFTTVLSVSTQRFFSFLTGKGETAKLKQVFTASVVINLVAALLVVVLFETVAVWFLNTYMDIPPSRLSAANMLAQCVVGVSVFSLVQTPFSAAVISNEDMGWYAGISAADVCLRLVAALLIGTAGIDNLVFYGLGLLAVAALVFAGYAAVAMSRYGECRFVRVADRGVYRQLLSFSGWVLFGSLANVGLVQGNVVLLNVFFGPIVNAAFAVSLQVYNAFTSLANSVMVAVRPSMNRLYAEGDVATLMRMFQTSNKFLLGAIACVAVPLMFEMEFVLDVWLGGVDGRTVLFCRLLLVYMVVIVLNSPITIMMQSAGRLRFYHLSVECVTLLCVPLTFLLFTLGAPDHSVYFSMTSLAVVAHGVRLYCMKRCYDAFSVAGYLRGFLLRMGLPVACACALAWGLCATMADSWARLLVVGAASSLLLAVIAMLVGLDGSERRLVLSVLKIKRSEI